MSRFTARLERIAAKVNALPCRVCKSLRQMLFYIEGRPGDAVGEEQWDAVGGKCPRCGSEPDRIDFVVVHGPDDVPDADAPDNVPHTA